MLRRSLLAASIALFGCSGGEHELSADPAQQAAPDVEDAKSAALEWLELVDEGDYGESWDEAAELFRGAVAKEQWARQVGGVRGPLGDVESREVSSATAHRSVPGAPDGDYVVIEYRTRFENKSSAVETVTPMRDPDGTYRVSGYYVR